MPLATNRLDFTRLSASFSRPVDDRSTYFGLRKWDDYIIGAHGFPGNVEAGSVGGVIVIDITDKTSPTKLYEATMRNEANDGDENFADCRDAIPFGTPGTPGAFITVCWRKGSFGADPQTAESMVYNIDVSDPLPANWGVDAANWATNHYFTDTQATPPGDAPLFSAMATDGVFIYISCQKNGVKKFDPRNLGQGPIAENNNHAIEDWETQGLYVYGEYVYVANYVNGFRIINKSDLADLDNDAGIFAREQVESVPVRPWDCTPDATGNYLFVSFNSALQGDDTAISGLQVMDISDPENASLLSSNAIPQYDRDVFITGSRDPACLRTSHVDNLVLLANRRRGVAVWDVADPTAPVYRGVFGNLDTAAGSTYSDTISGSVAWEEDGEYFIAYGDGYQANTNGSKQFYIDQITGDNMAHIYIGFRPEDGTDDDSQTVSNTVPRGVANDVGSYDVPAGFQLVEYGFRIDPSTVDDRDIEFGLYPATSASNGTPSGNLVASSDTTYDVGTVPGVATDTTVTLGTPLALAAGNYAPAFICTDGANVLVRADAAYTNPSGSAVTAGTGLPATWSQNSTSNRGVFVWAGLDAVSGPTISSQYDDQSDDVDVAISSLDLNSNWTSILPASTVVNNLPDGLSASAGVVTGTPTRRGRWQVEVIVTGGTGTLNRMSFTWKIPFPKDNYRG